MVLEFYLIFGSHLLTETTWSQIGNDSLTYYTSSEEGKKVRAIISYTDGRVSQNHVTATSSIEIKTDDGDAAFSISGTTSVGQSLSISESTPDPDGTGTLSYVWQSSSDNSFWTQIGSNSLHILFLHLSKASLLEQLLLIQTVKVSMNQ